MIVAYLIFEKIIFIKHLHNTILAMWESHGQIKSALAMPRSFIFLCNNIELCNLTDFYLSDSNGIIRIIFICIFLSK